MALLALTVAGLVAGGIALPAVALTSGIWLISLWFEWLRPAPPEEPFHITARPDLDALARTAMQSAIEPVGIPLLLTDRTRIFAANAAARMALGAHVNGQDARVALRHPDAVRLLDMVEGGTVTLRGLTGARSLWQMTRVPLPGDAGAGLWLIELRDRTAEADIGRAHTDFVANASHELRTPLSSVIGYVETLAENPAGFDAATMAKFLGTALREARRMDGLVSDLMSLSQLEAEKHDAPTGHVELASLVARVAGEFAHEPRVRFERPAAILVAGDTRQLEQLVRNLVDNALKYADADKPVEVGLRPAGGDAVLVVKDHGPGIAADHLPHLTRRFYRTDPGRSRAAGGTGLGLAIVKHIVERHRGTLDIA
ncbi:MAG: two-component sensor histidine kinase, partial [Sphingomonadales bacterium]|nr:two-component sensor histidine kinase [Sphingomonadales bacterium]